ncbi:hypothetical protein PCC8801_4546 (plasmid) [Rippkaea orientalis PCC 8801]|uniref:Uncharacterized protein n=1 Tax=Rippkaea orientalis (strain PCC 8801 / RF-1) TaxID=41431 RepID=B7K6N3_RIPO1|nr:hypothetical protein PCC8801_4546 [Rippkaea orientalis PCC 8801]
MSVQIGGIRVNQSPTNGGEPAGAMYYYSNKPKTNFALLFGGYSPQAPLKS